MGLNDQDLDHICTRSRSESKQIEFRLLPDIQRGPTWTEAYRMRCEARMLMAWPRYRRIDYYERIQKRRGETYAAQLIAEVRLAYEESQR